MSNITETPLDHLVRIDKFIASISDLETLLNIIIQEATRLTNATSCSLALYEEDKNELYFHLARGEKEERDFERKLKFIRLPMGSGILGWCAENRKTLNIKDAYQDDRFNKAIDEKTGFRTKSILAVPMIHKEKLIGVVEAVNKNDGSYFTEHDEKMLTILTSQAALVLENARLIEENIKRVELSALGEGIAGAAHCIKNILQVMENGEYIINTALSDKNIERIEKGWNTLNKNTEILKSMVLDMLEYSKFRKPEYAPSNINEICSVIHNQMQMKFKEKNIESELILDKNINRSLFDPKGIFRSILNIVGNAVDAIDKEKGKISITTKLNKTTDRLEITVMDNGCGISPENLEKITQAFFSTKGTKGTGLGLAVTQKIINEHGGSITVESEINSGSTFKIILPYLPHTQ